MYVCIVVGSRQILGATTTREGRLHGHRIVTININRPFAANDHVVQNPPCWRASSLLFSHWDIKTKASQASLVQVSLFYCPSAGIIMSLPSSMADFVPRDR